MDEKKPEAPPQPQPIPIKADDQVQAGQFSNVARIWHDGEAFQVDFLVIHAQPPFGRLLSRIILTPGHAKRLVRALAENVERYERAHGEIRLPESPHEGYLQ